MSKIKFSEADKERIKKAVEQAEAKTSGEIVPYFVSQSDNYYEVPFIVASLVGVSAIVFLNILSQMWLLPFEFSMLYYGLIISGLMIVSALIAWFIPPIKRAVVPNKREAKMALKRAAEAFITEEVFNTKDRTGILIFVSEFEHKVDVIADSGINQKVGEVAWADVAETVTKAIKKNKTTDGIVQAIEKCEKLLLDAGFAIKPDDTNELSNELRVD